ncbi:MAG: prephenate dehydrogenase/arogenate dehydrogenase family protein [Pseudomonadales bacterium]|nr:prephenate dehydrogenase/arogenate dehydrogenase family protein [Pseudomonadales bacterium]
MLADNVLIIGAGLIGGSLAKGLRDRNLANTLVGYGRRLEPLRRGIELGVLDQIASDLPAAIAAADIIVLGVPTLTIKDYLPLLAQHKKPQCVVTDAASVKGEIAKVIRDVFTEIPPWFVLGHPIAGSEKSGIEASDADLYVNHKVILTPDENTDDRALQLITRMWAAVGAEVICMGIDEHDRVLAATSHLPHAIAFTLVNALVDMDAGVEDIFRYAAGGFRDFSRIAASHPVMWHDIMIANKTAVLDVMGDFKQALTKMEQAIADEDSEALLHMFQRSKDARDHFTRLLEASNRPTK